MTRAGDALCPTLVLCCFIVFPLDLRADASTYEGKNIARIVFVPREQPLDPDELYRILPVKERTKLRLEDVRASIDRLYATGVYADIQVDAELSNGDVVLRFITQNNWFIGRVAVEGQIKDPPNPGQLINASRLELGELQTDEKVQQGANGIQELFESNGFYQSQVQPRFAYDPRLTQVRVDYVVDSGHRARYAIPNVEGDLKMPPGKVISATKWKGWFGWKPVTQSRTQRGLQNVRKQYQKQDRLMARVTLDDLTFD